MMRSTKKQRATLRKELPPDSRELSSFYFPNHYLSESTRAGLISLVPVTTTEGDRF
jgi:hypothetical protein